VQALNPRGALTYIHERALPFDSNLGLAFHNWPPGMNPSQPARPYSHSTHRSCRPPGVGGAGRMPVGSKGVAFVGDDWLGSPARRGERSRWSRRGGGPSLPTSLHI